MRKENELFQTQNILQNELTEKNKIIEETNKKLEDKRKARLEIEKEKARLETENEKAKLKIEREKTKLEIEKEKMRLSYSKKKI